MENLKPCPFCGGEANLHHVGNDFTKNRKVVIKCLKCRITRTDAALTHGFDWLDNVAIAKWNQRAYLDLEAQLAQAKADNAAMLKVLRECYNRLDDSYGELEQALSSTHPGADLLKELEQYKASDASKEQYIAEIYSRAREAERELEQYKMALGWACTYIQQVDRASHYHADLVDRFLNQAKEALTHVNT